MEFKINKIDVEVRERVNEKTKGGKVHSKETIKINKDSQNEEDHREEFKDVLSKKKNIKKKIVVQARKDEKTVTDTFKDENDDTSKIGKFLDVRK